VVRPFWLSVRWPVISALALVGLALGYVGFDSYFEARGVEPSGWDKLYFALQLFGLQSEAADPPIPSSLQTARLLAPLVAAYAAVSAIGAIFRDQIAQTRVRWFTRDHVIVCGLERTGHLLAQAFRDENHRVVVIEKDANNGAIVQCREGGVTVLLGDVTDGSVLAKARVDRARYLFAVSADDGANAQVAIDARELAGRRRRPLTCFVQILDPGLAEFLGAEIASGAVTDFRLEFFNPAERGVAPLLNDYPPFDDIGDTPFGPPHLLVVGLGQMGGRLVLHAVQRWTEVVGPDGPRLRVSVVDRDAEGHIRKLVMRHPQLEKVCELIPHVIEVDSPEFERSDFLFDPDGRHVTGIYVCLGDDAKGLAAALRLWRRFRGLGVLIVVRTKQHGGLGTLLRDAGGYDDLHVFGLLDLVCRPDVVLAGRTEILARAIHEEYVRNRAEEGDAPETNSSMRPWGQLAEEIRESNRRHADDIGSKLRAIGCDIEPLTDWSTDSFAFEPDELDLLARMEHERWLREKLTEGWSYGPKRDDDKHIHPTLLTWPKLSGEERVERYGPEWAARLGDDELPENEKKKDRELVLGIPAFLAKAGLRIARRERTG